MKTVKIYLYICILVFVFDGASSTEANTNSRRYAKRKSNFATDEELAEVKGLVLQLQTAVNSTKRYEAQFELKYDGNQQLFETTIDPYMLFTFSDGLAKYAVPEDGTYVYSVRTDNPESVPVTVSTSGRTVLEFVSQPGRHSVTMGLVSLAANDVLTFTEDTPSDYYYTSGFVYKL